MSYKSIQLYCPTEKINALMAETDLTNVIESRAHPCEDGTTYIYLLVPAENVQTITDAIQNILGSDTTNRTTVMTIDAVIPKPEATQDGDIAPQNEPKEDTKRFLGISREELLESVAKGVAIDKNFFLLVIFSTIVAAIGLLQDNLVVIIGAMVIAPLLGPILALAFASSLGNLSMIRQALKANAAGFTICLSIAILLGLIWPYSLDSNTLLMHTDVSFDSVILATVSGAAAVLSLTRGVSSVMVGVMVATALLPPTTTFGIMLGSGHFSAASGALLLLAVNVVCINLAAKIMLLWQGIRPRTWYEQKTAKHTSFYYFLFWSIALLILVAIIAVRIR